MRYLVHIITISPDTIIHVECILSSSIAVTKKAAGIVAA